MAIWKGSRGLAGKSLQLALLAYMEMVFLGAETAVLGGSGDQSKRVHAYQDYFWQHRNAPRNMLLREPGETKTELRNGGDIICLKASQASVRGLHPQRLRLDEIDEMEQSIFDAAQGQTMESTLRSNGVKPQTVASSTHQHADGTMTAALALANERGWPVFEWCYKESATAWLTEEMIATKRNEMTAETWRVEVELGEPSIGNRAMDTAKVDAMFDPELGMFDGAPEEYIQLENPLITCEHENDFELVGDVWRYVGPHDAENPDSSKVTAPVLRNQIERSCVCIKRIEADPAFSPDDAPAVAQAERRYTTGADWAKERDWTIIATYRTDVEPRRLVAYLRTGRKPWPLMVKHLDDRLRRFQGACYYDQTGVGNVVRDLLTVRASGFVLTGANEDNLLSEYIAAIEKGMYKSPRIRHAYAEHKLATMNQIYGSDHLPDTICAGALAHRAAKRTVRRFSAVDS